MLLPLYLNHMLPSLHLLCVCVGGSDATRMTGILLHPLSTRLPFWFMYVGGVNEGGTFLAQHWSCPKPYRFWTKSIEKRDVMGGEKWLRCVSLGLLGCALRERWLSSKRRPCTLSSTIRQWSHTIVQQFTVHGAHACRPSSSYIHMRACAIRSCPPAYIAHTHTHIPLHCTSGC